MNNDLDTSGYILRRILKKFFSLQRNIRATILIFVLRNIKFFIYILYLSITFDVEFKNMNFNSDTSLKKMYIIVNQIFFNKKNILG